MAIKRARSISFIQNGDTVELIDKRVNGVTGKVIDTKPKRSPISSSLKVYISYRGLNTEIVNVVKHKNLKWTSAAFWRKVE